MLNLISLYCIVLYSILNHVLKNPASQYTGKLLHIPQCYIQPSYLAPCMYHIEC